MVGDDNGMRPCVLKNSCCNCEPNKYTGKEHESQNRFASEHRCVNKVDSELVTDENRYLNECLGHD